MGAGLAGQPQCQARDAAIAHRERRAGALHVLLHTLGEQQRRAQRCGDLVLPAQLLLRGADVAEAGKGRRAGQRVVVVHRARQPDHRAPALPHRAGQLGRQHLGTQLGAGIGAGAVVQLRRALRLEQGGLGAPGTQLQAQAAVDAALLEAVVVGVVAAEGHAGVGGREAVAAAVLQAQAAVEAAAAEAGTACQFAVALAAHRGHGFGHETGPAAPREDLDHAADGVRAVQARERPTHDLDALDAVERDVVPAGRAQRGRAVAHAVDQQQRVAALEPAQRHRGRLAQPAVAPELQPALAGQQLGQRAARSRLDARAVDDADLGQGLVHTLRRTAGGDDDGFCRWQ